MEILFFPYVLFAIYFMRGLGEVAPVIAKWKYETDERHGNKVYLTQFAKAGITWPWFDINKVRELYP